MTKSVAPNKTPQTKTLEKKTPKLAPTPEIKPKTQQSTLNMCIPYLRVSLP